MAAIDRLGSSSPWSERQFHAACAAEGRDAGAWVAEVDHRIAGFLVWQRVLDEASIHNVAVAPQARRRGIASHLLRHLRASLPEDTRRCLLEVRASNHGALTLYRGLGFVEDGRRRDYYPTAHGREDAVLMSLDLQETQCERT